ncbi:hypothetical protein BOX15_Mlig016451g4, partial [Macrostomum lignano]
LINLTLASALVRGGAIVPAIPLRSLCRRLCSREGDNDDRVENDKFNGIIPMEQVRVSHMTSGGPGGQHVNKTQSKVEVRLHLSSATFISEPVKAQIRSMQASRVNKSDWLIVTSERTKRQVLNQTDCLDKLRTFIRQAEAALRPRPPPSPEVSAALARRRQLATERRLAGKSRRSMDKVSRRGGGSTDWA